MFNSLNNTYYRGIWVTMLCLIVPRFYCCIPDYLLFCLFLNFFWRCAGPYFDPPVSYIPKTLRKVAKPYITFSNLRLFYYYLLYFFNNEIWNHEIPHTCFDQRPIPNYWLDKIFLFFILTPALSRSFMLLLLLLLNVSIRNNLNSPFHYVSKSLKS